MKSTRYESYGVHLGWSIPTGDGFILRFDDGHIEWSYAYVTLSSGQTVQSPREALNEPRQKAFEARVYGD